MISSLIGAFLFAAIPLFAVTYLLIGWAIKSGKIGDFQDRKGFEAAVKTMREERKKQKKDKSAKATLKNENLFTRKWFDFGGGFYGLMALITYAYIEIIEVFQFIGKLMDLSIAKILSNLGFDILVAFIINSIMNLVNAFIWFIYWKNEFDLNHIWIWIIMAYLGYLAGAKMARDKPEHYQTVMTKVDEVKSRTRDTFNPPT
ncbi:hypothetical protein [Kordiimonas sp. SCSIO 12610]|uniref:hypothetical protein n=1 Tax=Kordiimonas sp. SCSIO 12610 TaxID=2829597 RepID=UPI00210870FA|nr:hypothetical protein [Kordiimonas sp. SCSIO 12610]UTW56058.1 hypothetical protein KFF44_03965 [Kordiimonas sp. SCSIO 12610]